MRLPATLSLVLVAIATLRAEAPSVQGTLPEDFLPGLRPLLKEAVERSPTTISANISLAQAEAARYLNASQLWPQIYVSADYQREQQSISRGTPSTSKGLLYSAGINQPIFQWGALKNQAEVGNLGAKVAERQFAEAYRLLAVTIRENYMSLVERKIQLRNQRFSQKIAEELLAAQQAKFEAGSSSEAELQGFKISLEEAKLATDRVEEDFHYAKRVFTRLVGIEDLSDDSFPIELPHPEFSARLADAVLTGFVGDGVESTFQSQVYQTLVRQQDLNYSIAKVRLLPRFYAAANYSYSNQDNLGGGTITQVGVRSESYSFGANWTIFDGFATKGSKLSALANKRLYERLLQTYVDSTIDTITDLRRQLGFSSRAMSLAEVHNALIEAEVKRLGDDKNLGYASQATIDSGILNLDATQYNMAYARTDYLSRWVEFVSLAGIDPALSNIAPRYVR